ncbi:MAG: DUF1285 domain-containing protein [Deltaproteobacteria bacterium]|nr:DUF1285 domain-containing protein [Deltaproteobacteria bacterium]
MKDRQKPFRIDKEGIWYFHGVEMIRRDIVFHISSNIARDGSGAYFLDLPEGPWYIEVEDAPFAVRSFLGESNPPEILLNDGSRECLNPHSLIFDRENNVPYCLVRQGSFLARFTRAAYYQLTAFIDCDSVSGEYYLNIEGSKHCIQYKNRRDKC